MQRLVLGATIALVFSPLLGLPLCLGWLAIYASIQGLEAWLAQPVAKGRISAPDGWRTLPLELSLFLNASFLGAITVPLWLMGGTTGGVVAAVLLSAGMINSIIMSMGDWRVFNWTVLPQLVYLALTPVFMGYWGAERYLIAALAIGVLTYALFCFSTRARLNRAMLAEHRAVGEANRKRREAENSMAERSAFLAAIGHDLRTPISAIMTGADALRQPNSGASTRQHVALIEDAGLMMKALLDDLLDHARLNAGRMHVDSRDFDLRLLMAQTARMWHAPARAKGLRLRLEGARATPQWARGDAMRLRQVLNNLISNAMKFTEAGSVTVAIRSWPDEIGDHVLLIEVADTGQGMSRAQLDRLFTPFDQTQDGVAARFGGSGLGLAISRDLIELMGGRLTARSAPGQGARFTIALTLPRGAAVEAAVDVAPAPAPPPAAALAPQAAKPPAAQKPSAPPPSPVQKEIQAASASASDASEERPLRVLVVDDHAINRRAVQLILQAFDCEITMAENGLAALELCTGQIFDVVFMDVRMPELDGRETTRRLRAQAGPNARTPVIAVTADTEPEDMEACLAAGMNAFISKPLTPAALLNTLSQTLDAAAIEDGEAAA